MQDLLFQIHLVLFTLSYFQPATLVDLMRRVVGDPQVSSPEPGSYLE